MNNNITGRSAFTAVTIIIGVALTAFILFGLLPVIGEYKAKSALLTPEQSIGPEALTRERTEQIEKIIALRHYESFLKSELDLAKSDSISLLIDLEDSVAKLSFKGVTLFESGISMIYLSKGLERLPLYLRDSLFSGPLLVNEELSSIEKYPVVVKKAPKDTTEARVESAPTLPVQNDVFVLFSFDNNLIIEINQEERSLAGSKAAFREYRREYRKWFGREYTYRLEIRLPREDTRSIYRALPLKPQVVIRY